MPGVMRLHMGKGRGGGPLPSHGAIATPRSWEITDGQVTNFFRTTSCKTDPVSPVFLVQYTLPGLKEKRSYFVFVIFKGSINVNKSYFGWYAREQLN